MDVFKDLLARLPLRAVLTLLFYGFTGWLILIRFTDSYIQDPTFLGLDLSAYVMSWVLLGLLTALLIGLVLIELQDNQSVFARAAQNPPLGDAPLNPSYDEGLTIQANARDHRIGIVLNIMTFWLPIGISILSLMLVTYSSLSTKYDVCVRSDNSRAYYCHTR